MGEDHKAEAVRLLERARRTSRLEKVPEEGEPGYDGYQEIEDDLSDMSWHLARAGMELEDIGTDEPELVALKRHSWRLNMPCRQRQQGQKRDAWD